MQIIMETQSERYRNLEFDCNQRNHFVFLALDPCSNDPCQNGVCNSTAVGYKCTCYSGYAGTNCDKGLYTSQINTKKTYLPDLETKVTFNREL